MIDNKKSKSYPRTSSALRTHKENSETKAKPRKGEKVEDVKEPIRQGKKTIEDAPSLGEEQAP